MSLYLKYRPQNFKTLVGQTHAKKTIQNALMANNLSHAYLFCGPRGTGKTSLARILAKGLNCTNPQEGNEPCNECNICDSINNGKLVDLIEIDAASNRGIDEIRELREKIVFSPSQAKTKVYIIDEVHMLTKEAFNALLKTLEEPPSHAYFILATTEAHKIPETIISRCQQFTFSRIADIDIVGRLDEIAQEEDAKTEIQALEMIAKLSSGGLRDAIGLLEQMMASGGVTLENVSENLGLSGNEHLEKFFNYLINKKALKAIKLLNQMKAGGHSMAQFTKEIIAYFRDQMLSNLEAKKETRNIIKFIEIFSEAKLQLDLSPIPELPIEIAIIKSCQFDMSAPEADESVIEEKVEAPKVVSEEAPKSEAPILTEGAKITFEQIKKDWNRLLEAIETPFIRMSLMDGELKSLDGNVLTLTFKSSMYMEKISSGSNQKEVQAAFDKVFGMTFALNLEVKKIDISIEKKTEAPVVAEKSSSAVEMAEEVFGTKTS